MSNTNKQSTKTLNLKSIGVLDLMDLNNLLKELKEANIDWEQKNPGSITIKKSAVNTVLSLV